MNDTGAALRAMSVPVLTTEPTSIVVGDTAVWTKSVPDYLPSAGWTLNYSLQGSTIAGNNAALITFSSSTNSGSTYSISLLKATTAAWAPGAYHWSSYVSSTTERHFIAGGDISIVPDPSVAIPASHAVSTLALIEAAIVGRVPAHLTETIIDGQTLIRLPLDRLLELRLKYKAEVRAEQNAQRIAAGLPNNRTAFARFTRPL